MKSRIISKLFIFAVFSFYRWASAEIAITLNCKYHGLEGDYVCAALGLENFDGNSSFFNVTGNHLKEKSITDVIGFVVKNQNSKYIPRNVSNFFPHLTLYEVRNSSTIAVNKENFEGLEKLETVIIEHNFIESLSSDIFNDLIALKYLRLSGNRITRLHFDIFARNTKLVKISLSGNRITFIHEMFFENLINLKQVQLQHNEIADVRDRTFGSNTLLEELDLSSNNLTFIGPQLFDNLINLKKFDFSNNICIKNHSNDIVDFVDSIKEFCFPPYFRTYEDQVKNLEKAVQSLNESLVNCETNLKATENQLVVLKTELEKENEDKSSMQEKTDTCGKNLESLKNVKEESQAIIENLKANITTCEAGCSISQSSLKYFNTTISDCQLKLDVFTRSIQTNENLQVIDHAELKKQLKSRDEEVVALKQEIENLKRRVELMGETVGSSTLNSNEPNAKCLELLNSTRALLVSREDSLKSCVPQSSICRYFYITCSFEFDKSDYVCKASNIAACTANMTLAGVTGIHPHLKSNENVNSLEISDSMFQLTNDIFDHLPSLRKLRIVNSGLSSLLPKITSQMLKHLEIEENLIVEIPGRAFEFVRRLESLYLDHNGIEIVDRDAFVGLELLKGLSLKENRISELPEGVFDSLRELTHLSLKNNRLTSLRGELLRYSPKLQIAKFDTNMNLAQIGVNILDFARIKTAHFADTCVGEDNAMDIEEVKRRISQNCHEKKN